MQAGLHVARTELSWHTKVKMTTRVTHQQHRSNVSGSRGHKAGLFEDRKPGVWLASMVLEGASPLESSEEDQAVEVHVLNEDRGVSHRLEPGPGHHSRGQNSRAGEKVKPRVKNGAKQADQALTGQGQVLALRPELSQAPTARWPHAQVCVSSVPVTVPVCQPICLCDMTAGHSVSQHRGIHGVKLSKYHG